VVPGEALSPSGTPEAVRVAASRFVSLVDSRNRNVFSHRRLALLKEPIMLDVRKIDVALDEVLVKLGAMVLRLADPSVTRTVEERRALAQSVRQYGLCADKSADPRVHELRSELEETIKPGWKPGCKPSLRLVSSQ
jgi:hypothetical protein